MSDLGKQEYIQVRERLTSKQLPAGSVFSLQGIGKVQEGDLGSRQNCAARRRVKGLLFVQAKFQN